MLGRLEGVAIAGEDQLAAGKRAGPHVEDAVVEPGFAFFRLAQVAGPVGGTGVRRPFLVRQPDQLARLDVNLENIGPAKRRLPVLARSLESLEVREKHPGAVEGDIGIGNRAVVAALDEDFLAAVGMQEHHRRP